MCVCSGLIKEAREQMRWIEGKQFLEIWAKPVDACTTSVVYHRFTVVPYLSSGLNGLEPATPLSVERTYSIGQTVHFLSTSVKWDTGCAMANGAPDALRLRDLKCFLDGDQLCLPFVSFKLVSLTEK